MNTSRIKLPVDEIVRRYEAGESTYALGRAYGVSRWTIMHRLYGAGARMRRAGGVPGNRSKLGQHNRGGSLHINDAGYLGTRDREGNKCYIHRGCWEAYYGPILEGHDIHHIDENRQQNVIGNLRCMTHGEHARLHKESG